ncbi:hypothetical protein HDV05_001429, partial [Chytridiales sp. JEL 0842]
MVVRIRLARWGARNNPFYGVVIARDRAPRDRNFIERVGTYNPIPDSTGTKHVELNWDRVKYWLGVGAQPSDRVAWLLAKANLMPLTPVQLQRQGALSLSDPKTWKLKVTEANGTEKIYTIDEAKRLFQGKPELAAQIPKDATAEPPKK